jgi:hypothetical protein
VVGPAPISARRAYEMLSELGGQGNALGRGTGFFGFRFNDGRPLTEAHRNQTVQHLDESVIPQARSHQARIRRQVEAGDLPDTQLHACGETLKDLEALRRFLATTPLRRERA